VTATGALHLNVPRRDPRVGDREAPPGPACVGRGQAPIGVNVWYGDPRGYRPIQQTEAVLGQYCPVCGQSSTSSENGRDPCRGAIGESPTGSHQKFIVPGQGLPRAIASHCPRPLRGRGRRPEAGRGGGYEEGSTSSAAWGGGARPLPGPHPPGRCPPRSTAWVSRGIPRVHQNRHGGSTELAPRR
jgi:hypothetical protein